MSVIKTPKPPLNLFDVARVPIPYNSWATIYEVDTYLIPGNNIVAAKVVQTATIMTGLLITNLSLTDNILISVRIEKLNEDLSLSHFPVLHQFPIPISDFASIKLDRQVMKPSEKLQVICWTNTSDGETAVAHFSYILNQVEDFTVLA